MGNTDPRRLSDMDPAILGRKTDASAVEGFLPYLQNEIALMERAVENRMFSALKAGTLTPEGALQGWQEKKALRDLLRRFEGIVTVGKSSGKAFQDAILS